MILFIFILLWNMIVMFLYSADKYLARTRRKRISEASLLSAAFLFGAAGAILGMLLFNHKTSKTKFRILIPLALLFNVAFILYLLYNESPV